MCSLAILRLLLSLRRLVCPYSFSSLTLVVLPPIDVNITWLLVHLDENKMINFRIDRDSNDCHTPRRNSEVKAAFAIMQYASVHLKPLTDSQRYLRVGPKVYELYSG